MENNARSGKTYKDKEMPLFYWTVAGIPGVVTLLAVSEHEWGLAMMLIGIALIFLICGWPLKAVVGEKYEVAFIGPIRRSKVTTRNLASIKAVGTHDYRAHIVIRTKYGLPIGYRCRKYSDAAELATVILKIAQKTPNANVSDDGQKLLMQMAKIRA